MSELPIDIAKAVQNLGAKSVYGDPIELNNTTLVPVSLSFFGFGGGKAETSDDSSVPAGSGGGGGGYSIPLGAYVSTKETAARFEPNVISLLAVGIPFVFVAGNVLVRLIKILNK